MTIYTVFVNGREGAELYNFDQAVTEAYEQISRKNRDADTDHCIAELETTRSSRFADTFVEIRESEYADPDAKAAEDELEGARIWNEFESREA